MFRSVWFLSFFLVNTAILGLLSIIVSIWSAKGARRFARIWGRANAWGAGVPLTVEGLENLPRGPSGKPDVGMIVAVNHSSAADIGAVLAGLPLDICWVTKAALLRVPILGWHLKRVHIPIQRRASGNAGKLVRDGARKIQDGAAVVIFPEGTRNRGPEKLLPFKKGAFLLAHVSKRPIVPVGIIGATDVWPPEKMLPVPGKVILRIGKPIDPTKFSTKEMDRLADETREAIAGLLDDSTVDGQRIDNQRLGDQTAANQPVTNR